MPSTPRALLLGLLLVVSAACGAGEAIGTAATSTTSPAVAIPSALPTSGSTPAPPGAATGAGAAGVPIDGKVNDRGRGTVAGGTVAIEVGDSYFSPTVIDGPAGTSVTVTLANVGATSHTFTIPDEDVDLVLPAGGSATVEVPLPSSGTLEFRCRFHGFAGMRGVFVTH